MTDQLITNLKLIGAIDQGTSSSRFLIFDSQTFQLITYHQINIEQVYPQEGWVEESPIEILESVKKCIEGAIENLTGLGICSSCIKTIGITNQRETTISWDKSTGLPLYNALVWLDTRTKETVEKLLNTIPCKNKNYFKAQSGLPLSTYFSATKIKWLMDNSYLIREAVSQNQCMFGNVDSWLLWNLTGGINGGVFKTDVTNASRTMLMNIHTMQWDPTLLKFFNVSEKVLPSIHSSSEIFGLINSGPLKGVPISGILGDQQAALVGHGCFNVGQTKNTYGTGCFLLTNIGNKVILSNTGLLTTVAYQLGPNISPCYALEGSVAIAGASVQWLKDNLEIIDNFDQIEKLASSVEDTGGCYFVPAFSGLFCPYWETNARGIICGLSQYSNKAHIARACLEAVCFQTKEVLDAVKEDTQFNMEKLEVDGKMITNNLLMQLQSDILGITVVRPSMPELTALGVAVMAGQAKGIDVCNIQDVLYKFSSTDSFEPSITDQERHMKLSWWKKAVERCRKWNIEPTKSSEIIISSSLPYTLFMFGSFALLLLSHLYKSRS